jgi:hypothetical protein
MKQDTGTNIPRTIRLKKDPLIEFRLENDGFYLNDVQHSENNGFYCYDDLNSVELNRVWFPKLSIWMRIITTILNGVPFFPDADSYKTASLILRSNDSDIGIWLTDISMANSAKKLKMLLDQKQLSD